MAQAVLRRLTAFNGQIMKYASGMGPELEVYAQQTRWLLGQFERNLAECDRRIWEAVPPVAVEGNNLLAIAKHASGVTRAYALGIGCGQAVKRNRTSEFIASASEGSSIVSELRSLADEATHAFQQLDPGALDRTVVPPQELYGVGPPRAMTAREAIVENIRHLGIHLGELRLTRSLLENASRAD
jgi:hypothetical protein